MLLGSQHPVLELAEASTRVFSLSALGTGLPDAEAFLPQPAITPLRLGESFASY